MNSVVDEVVIVEVGCTVLVNANVPPAFCTLLRVRGAEKALVGVAVAKMPTTSTA